MYICYTQYRVSIFDPMMFYEVPFDISSRIFNFHILLLPFLIIKYWVFFGSVFEWLLRCCLLFSGKICSWFFYYEQIQKEDPWEHERREKEESKLWRKRKKERYKAPFLLLYTMHIDNWHNLYTLGIWFSISETFNFVSYNETMAMFLLKPKHQYSTRPFFN